MVSNSSGGEYAIDGWGWEKGGLGGPEKAVVTGLDPMHYCVLRTHFCVLRTHNCVHRMHNCAHLTHYCVNAPLR